MVTLTTLFDKAMKKRKKSIGTQANGDKVPRVPTSIRLSEQAHEFYVQQAQALCTTPSALINQVLNVFAANADDIPLHDRRKEMESRVLKVFDAQKMALTDILTFFNMLHEKHGRSPLKLDDLDSMSTYIDDLILREIAEFFSWSLRWLQGKSDYINDGCNGWTWYKNQHGINNRLIELVKEYGNVRVEFFCSDFYPISQAYVDKQDEREPLYVGAIIEYDKKLPNETIITTRQCLQIERWNYWRLRHHYKQFALFCSHLAYLTGKVQVNGYILPEAVIQDLKAAKIHPIDVVLQPGWKSWPIHNYASFESSILYETEEIQNIFEDYCENKYYQSMLTSGLVSEQTFKMKPIEVGDNATSLCHQTCMANDDNRQF